MSPTSNYILRLKLTPCKLYLRVSFFLITCSSDCVETLDCACVPIIDSENIPFLLSVECISLPGYGGNLLTYAWSSQKPGVGSRNVLSWRRTGKVDVCVFTVKRRRNGSEYNGCLDITNPRAIFVWWEFFEHSKIVFHGKWRVCWTCPLLVWLVISLQT